MGQITTGIMWGVRVPEGVCMWDDENFAGLLDRWCDAHRDLAGAERLAQTAPSLWLVPTEVA